MTKNSDKIINNKLFLFFYYLLFEIKVKVISLVTNSRGGINNTNPPVLFIIYYLMRNSFKKTSIFEIFDIFERVICDIFEKAQISKISGGAWR